MSDSPRPPWIIERSYKCVIWLYPAEFRSSYGSAMMQTVRDALADRNLSRSSLLWTLFLDLLDSLLKENIAMIRETFARPILVFNALILAALSTLLALAFYSIPQQVLRQGANDPQLELAGNVNHQIQHGWKLPTGLQLQISRLGSKGQSAPEADLGPDAKIDMAASLSPFVMTFDEQGVVQASSAQLAGKTPTPPKGVFDYARQHGEERVTWQPQPGVRIATVIQHIPGSNGGFVLAGRNMLEIEAREEQMGIMARYLWLAMLGVVLGGTFLFGWFTRKPAIAHPVAG
jgi:hypothetical protein